MFENFGVNTLSTDELEALFVDEGAQQSPAVEDGTESNSSDDTDKKDVSQTKAFAKRLAEEKAKVVNEERENIAKSLGFNSFEELQKSREQKHYEKAGLDPAEVSPVVEAIVQERINSDPRMKELERYRALQVQEFGRKELAEITKLTGGEITSLEQLSPDVIDLWKKKGSLKSAFLELKGEELILKSRSAQSKGSTSHLNNVTGNAGTNNSQRHLTAQERQMWRFFNPQISDEELDKKMVDKE
jgi:hypothetical protein